MARHTVSSFNYRDGDVSKTFDNVDEALAYAKTRDAQADRHIYIDDVPHQSSRSIASRCGFRYTGD